MDDLNNPGTDQTLNFFADSLQAISEQKYAKALEVTTAGLKRLVDEGVPVDARKLAISFLAVLVHLESRLRTAYGGRWEVQSGIPDIVGGEDEMRCSFCGKKQAEDVKLIAGPNVYICDGCVSICNQILG